MEGIQFSWNRQNTHSFGKFLAGNPTRPLSPIAPGRHGSSQVTSAMGSVSRSRSVLFEIEILCIQLFLNRNKNSKNSPKRMHPKKGQFLVGVSQLVVAPVSTLLEPTFQRATILFLCSRDFAHL